MKTDKHNVQIIHLDGEPAFAVIPYADYVKWMEQETNADSKTYLPHEVAELMLTEDLGYISAWRKHLGISQKVLAERMGVSQGAVSQMEKSDTKPQRKTLEKAAKAMGLCVEQLIDE